MGKEQGKEYYDKIFAASEEYHCHYTKSVYYQAWQVVMEYVKQFAEPKILEIGCGTGQFAHYLWDEGFKDYIGIDFSEEAIKKAREFSGQTFSAVDAKTFLTLFPHDRPDRDFNIYNLYDLVIVLEVLEHIEDDYDVIKQIKPGTDIIFSVPAFDCESHVRHFPKWEDITARYDDYILIKEIKRVGGIFVCLGAVK